MAGGRDRRCPGGAVRRRGGRSRARGPCAAVAAAVGDARSCARRRTAPRRAVLAASRRRRRRAAPRLARLRRPARGGRDRGRGGHARPPPGVHVWHVTREAGGFTVHALDGDGAATSGRGRVVAGHRRVRPPAALPRLDLPGVSRRRRAGAAQGARRRGRAAGRRRGHRAVPAAGRRRAGRGRAPTVVGRLRGRPPHRLRAPPADGAAQPRRSCAEGAGYLRVLRAPASRTAPGTRSSRRTATTRSRRSPSPGSDAGLALVPGRSGASSATPWPSATASPRSSSSPLQLGCATRLDADGSLVARRRPTANDRRRRLRRRRGDAASAARDCRRSRASWPGSRPLRRAGRRRRPWRGTTRSRGAGTAARLRRRAAGGVPRAGRLARLADAGRHGRLPLRGGHRRRRSARPSTTSAPPTPAPSSCSPGPAWAGARAVSAATRRPASSRTAPDRPSPRRRARPRRPPDRPARPARRARGRRRRRTDPLRPRSAPRNIALARRSDRPLEETRHDPDDASPGTASSSPPRCRCAGRRPAPSTSTRTPSTSAGWSPTAATASCPNGSLGEYQTLTAEERARVVHDRRRGRRPTAFAVMPGVAAYGARRGPALGRAGGRGRLPAVHAAAAERLPRRRARGASRTTARSPRPGCRSWPTTTPSTPRSTSTPELLAELHDEGLIVGGQGVHRRRPPGLRDRRAGARPRPCWSAPTTCCSSSRSPAPSAGSPATPTPSRAPASSCTGPRVAGDLDDRAAALPAAAPAAALGLARPSSCRRSSCRMDLVGRYGGPCRPPRVPLPDGTPRRVARRPPSRRWPPARAESRDAMRTRASSTRSTRTPRACRPG